MDSIVKLSDTERLELFNQTSMKLDIPVAMVEKDFWVCWILGRIFSDNQLCQVLRFRGGTSLSKGYNLIKRFSEDIDLTLDKKLVLTNENSRGLLRSKKLYKEHKEEVADIAAQYIGTVLKTEIANVLDNIVKVYTEEEYQKFATGLTKVSKALPERFNNQNLHIVYPKVVNDVYLRPDIFLEVGILSALTPNEPREILPHVAEQYSNLGIAPVIVPTIKATRTFWDKATILHREYYRPATKRDKETSVEIPSHTPDRYSRHYYDLYQMGHSAIKNDAFADFGLLQEVIEYKNQFYPCGWGHTFDECACGNLHLLPNENNRDLLAKDYKAMQTMIYGDKPSWKEILDYLAELETEINNLK